MTDYIPVDLRRLVTSRANRCCEYCRLHEADAFLPYEIDHIIPIKHRGETREDNLCLSCFDCNRYKGSDIGSIDIETHQFAHLFNARTMIWSEHFRLNVNVIEPLTPEGRVTVFLLRLNSEARLIRREQLIEMNRYPCLD